MAMSSGGSSELFKLAENAAPDENRLMPTERTYPRDVGSVSLEEAVALMKQRKRDPGSRIKGGLDDNSDAVRKNRRRPAADMAADKPSAKVGDEVSLKDLPDGVRPLALAETPEDGKARVRVSKGAMGEVVKSLNTLQNMVAMLHDKVTAPSSPAPEERKDILGEFKSSTHKVTFMLDGMEFSVKCLSMIKDTMAHTVVFVFDDSGETFFTPQMKSELKVKYDGIEDPGTLYYFGMSFSMDALGLRFLGFIYSDSEDVK